MLKEQRKGDVRFMVLQDKQIRRLTLTRPWPAGECLLVCENV